MIITKIYLKKGINTPKGMILYGPSGNGKTLIIKDIIENTKANVIIINGDSDNVLNETQKCLLLRLKRVGHSIIVIDELDLLLDDDTRLRRILQDNIDGVNANDDLLILTATNNIIDIPDAIFKKW
ncbi:MAG: ATP-binding protein [Clostridium sp.]|nr:MAG: ATP-binding protein [Clostridium sp.]